MFFTSDAVRECYVTLLALPFGYFERFRLLLTILKGSYPFSCLKRFVSVNCFNGIFTRLWLINFYGKSSDFLAKTLFELKCKRQKPLTRVLIKLWPTVCLQSYFKSKHTDQDNTPCGGAGACEMFISRARKHLRCRTWVLTCWKPIKRKLEMFINLKYVLVCKVTSSCHSQLA